MDYELIHLHFSRIQICINSHYSAIGDHSSQLHLLFAFWLHNMLILSNGQSIQ